MKRKSLDLNVNLGSLVVGFLLAVCLMLAAGAASGGSDEVGQYQCCAAGGDDLAVFVIETNTGQTWRLSRTEQFDFGTPYSRKSVRRSITPMLD